MTIATRVLGFNMKQVMADKLGVDEIFSEIDYLNETQNVYNGVSDTRFFAEKVYWRIGDNKYSALISPRTKWKTVDSFPFGHDILVYDYKAMEEDLEKLVNKTRGK